MSNRAMLLRRIQVAGFALQDAKLYLDVYPNNQEALAFYRKNLAIKNSAVAEYETKYGPLTAESYEPGNCWKWIEPPFPWHPDANN